MAVAVSLEPDRAGGCLDEAPFQIVVDVAAGAPVPDAASAGNDARDETGIAGEVFCSWESLDLADSSHGVLYSYFVPGGGYAPNGNLLVSSDSVMGDWYYTYDAVDRLMSATPDETAPSQYLGKYGCWTYDAYGNRTLEALSTIACSGSPTPQVKAVYNSANNRIQSISGNVSATFTYDAAGNTLSDAYNQYWYDAEGQLCAQQSLRTNNSPIYQYVYDAEGARVGKGTLASAPGTSTATCAPPFATGFTLATRYLVDLGGDQVTELNETGGEVWAHSNIWAGGKLTATYDTKGIHFDISDPLGTKRVQANAGGYMDEYCTSLPFGNDIGNLATVSCTTVGSPTNPLGTGDDATEHHFTQKERDVESGNDYFGARYYASSMGRFTSPDWSAKKEPVPYAKLDNPQTLNLYGYMQNNPLAGVDQDGHCSGDDCGKVSVTATTSGEAPLTTSDDGNTATVEGTVQYKFTYDGKPLTDTQIHEEVSNKSSRDGESEKAKLTTGDDATGPTNRNPPGVVTDTSNISITPPGGHAEAVMSNSVFTKETTQILSFKTPTGSACSVTETRTLSNADSRGQSSDTYQIKLTSPVTQQATPVKPPPPPNTQTK